MLSKWVNRTSVLCALFFCFAVSVAIAQQASPPSTMKPPGDPTSSTRPTTPAPDATATKPTAPDTQAEPAVDSAAKPALPASDNASSSSSRHNPAIPTTTVYPETDPKSVLAPKLDPGPLPKNKSALIGGTVRDIDQIRNQMTIDVFGKGGKMKVLFDPRTRFDRNGTPINQTVIKKGDMVYLDTQLVNHKIFARDVYIHTTSAPVDASGQIASYNPKSGMLTINDQMSGSQVTVQVSPNTLIKNRGASGSTGDLRQMALVSLQLSPGDGHHAANEIDIIALPGNTFTFYGTLTNVDLRNGVLAVDNNSDHKSYEIKFDRNTVPVTDELKVGNEVAVNAVFNGRDYTAQTLTFTSAKHNSDSNPE